MLFYQNSGDIGHIFLIMAVVIISIVLHELAHGYVALLNGDPTAKMYGRLTFNPMKHFDPFGFLMMIILGFGFAKPVPVNPHNFKNLRQGIFTTAVAGVTVNFLLALISMPLYFLFTFSVPVVMLSYFFMYMILLNANLIVFNLLPIFPLDGFRVVESFTVYTARYCTFMRKRGQYILLGLIALGFFADMLVSATNIYAFSFVDLLGTYLWYASRAIMYPFWLVYGFLFGVDVRGVGIIGF